MPDNEISIEGGINRRALVQAAAVASAAIASPAMAQTPALAHAAIYDIKLAAVRSEIHQGIVGETSSAIADNNYAGRGASAECHRRRVQQRSMSPAAPVFTINEAEARRVDRDEFDDPPRSVFRRPRRRRRAGGRSWRRRSFVISAASNAGGPNFRRWAKPKAAGLAG